jgi:hypothetical protein
MSENKNRVVFLDGLYSSMSAKRKPGAIKKKRARVYDGSDDLFRRKTSVVTNHKPPWQGATTGTKTIHEMVQQMLKKRTAPKECGQAAAENDFFFKKATSKYDDVLLVSSGSESIEEVVSDVLRGKGQSKDLLRLPANSVLDSSQARIADQETFFENERHSSDVDEFFGDPQSKIVVDPQTLMPVQNSFSSPTMKGTVTGDFGEALKSVLLLREQLLALQQENEQILKEQQQLKQLVKRHEAMIGLLEKELSVKNKLLFREKQIE